MLEEAYETDFLVPQQSASASLLSSALVLLVPIVVFWHYSMELTRKNMLSQTSNLIYTNLYGASLLMDDVMEQVSDFSREISSGPRLSLSDLPIPAGRCRF